MLWIQQIQCPIKQSPLELKKKNNVDQQAGKTGDLLSKVLLKITLIMQSMFYYEL